MLRGEQPGAAACGPEDLPTRAPLEDPGIQINAHALSGKISSYGGKDANLRIHLRRVPEPIRAHRAEQDRENFLPKMRQ